MDKKTENLIWLLLDYIKIAPYIYYIWCHFVEAATKTELHKYLVFLFKHLKHFQCK